MRLTYIGQDMFLDFADPPLPHDAIRVLFAGDASSVPTLRAMLASLPLCARGQVFVEVASEADVEPLTSPGRVTVTWLARDRRSGVPGSGLSCAPGEAVERAVRAWLAEMYVDADALAEAEHLIWIGGPEAFAWGLRRDLHDVFSRDRGATAV
ncbi:SIP domain-containing protein [Frigoribacterium faeni]|uniref:SIP domain-containing protein n=1 Tax=Frigoribacterium faeni TaxID=145483 RepID=UPI0032665051